MSLPPGASQGHVDHGERGKLPLRSVRFVCTIDWSRGTSRCNCSVCGKSRFWKTVIPSTRFRLLSGQEDLAQYRFGQQAIVHHFCRHCGVKTFGTGAHPALGGPFHAVNIACLDDLTPEEFVALRVKYEDGRSDHWELAPAVTGHL